MYFEVREQNLSVVLMRVFMHSGTWRLDEFIRQNTTGQIPPDEILKREIHFAYADMASFKTEGRRGQGSSVMEHSCLLKSMQILSGAVRRVKRGMMNRSR